MAAPVVTQSKKKDKPVRTGGSKELEKTVRRLERDIDAREQVIARLREQLEAASSDYQEYLRLSEELQQQESALEEVMLQWEEAAAQLEG